MTIAFGLVCVVAGYLLVRSHASRSARYGYQPEQPRERPTWPIPEPPSKFERLYGFDPRPLQQKPEPPPAPPNRVIREGDIPWR